LLPKDGLNLSLTDKLVLLQIVDFVNSENAFWCFPSLTLLSTRCFMSRSGLCNSLNKLEQLKILVRETGTKGKSTRYKVDVDGLSSACGMSIRYAHVAKKNTDKASGSKWDDNEDITDF
jgi:hypothetical protein